MLKHLKTAVACLAASTAIGLAVYNPDYIPLAERVSPIAIAYLLKDSPKQENKGKNE